MAIWFSNGVGGYEQLAAKEYGGFGRCEVPRAQCLLHSLSALVLVALSPTLNHCLRMCLDLRS